MTAITNECKCGRPTRDAAYVCDECADLLARSLGDIPWLDEQLEITTTRSAGIDYRTLGGATSTESPSPVHWAASEARTHLKALLVSWVLFSHQERVRNSAPCTCDNGDGPNRDAGTSQPGPDRHSAIPERG